MTHLATALRILKPNHTFKVVNGNHLIWEDERPQPTAEQIQEKIAELQAAEPMRLLRIQRDKKLQESDWRTNNDYPYDDADAWATYRTALRNLPAVISTGNVAAPVIQDGALVFDDWPQVPNA